MIRDRQARRLIRVTDRDDGLRNRAPILALLRPVGELPGRDVHGHLLGLSCGEVDAIELRERSHRELHAVGPARWWPNVDLDRVGTGDLPVVPHSNAHVSTAVARRLYAGGRRKQRWCRTVRTELDLGGQSSLSKNR